MSESASFALATATRYFALLWFASRYLISAVLTLRPLLLPPPPKPDCVGPAVGRSAAILSSAGTADHIAEVSRSPTRARPTAGIKRCLTGRRRGTRRATNRVSAAMVQVM